MALLTDLPPELLHKIYAHLRSAEEGSDAGPTCAPVCRALVPFTQAYRYRKPYFLDRTRAAQFARTISKSPELGLHVREVVFNLFDFPPSEAEPPSSGPADDLRECEQMWAHMPELQSVEVVNSSVVLTALLAIPPGIQLDRLRELSICDYFASKLDPFDLASYRNILAAALNLSSLSITVEDDFPLARSNIIQLPTSRTSVAHARLTELALHGYRPSHILSIAHVVNSFPALNKLGLYEFVDEGEFPPILSLLDLRRLRTLEIGSMRETATSGLQWRSLDLSSFAALDTFALSLGGCMSTFELVLSPTITRLEFGPHTDVPLSLLRRLLDPRNALHAPALRAIVLDCIGAKLGSSVFGPRGFPQTSEGETIYEPHRDWIRPRWTSNIGWEQLEDFVATAKRAGVALTGTTVVGLEVQRKYLEELEAIAHREALVMSRRVVAARRPGARGARVSARREDDSSDSEWEEW